MLGPEHVRDDDVVEKARDGLAQLCIPHAFPFLCASLGAANHGGDHVYMGSAALVRKWLPHWGRRASYFLATCGALLGLASSRD